MNRVPQWLMDEAQESLSVEKLRNKLSEYKESNRKLQANLATEQSKNRWLNNMLNTEKAIVTLLKDEITSLEQGIMAFSEHASEKENLLVAKECELDDMADYADMLVRCCESLLSTNSDLTNDCVQHVDRVKLMRKSLHEKETELTSEKLINEQLRKERDSLKEEVDYPNIFIQKQLVKDCELLSKEVNNLNTSLLHTRRDLLTQEQLVEQLTNKNSELEAELINKDLELLIQKQLIEQLCKDNGNLMEANVNR